MATLFVLPLRLGKSSDTQPESGVRVSVIRATTDSPMSPPPVSMSAPSVVPRSLSRGSSGANSIYSRPQSLLDLWLSRTLAARETRPEFHGRLNSEVLPDGTLRTKLYPFIMDDQGPRKNAHAEGNIPTNSALALRILGVQCVLEDNCSSKVNSYRSLMVHGNEGGG
uniref:Uncharacterized protein n=1 Tax=Timema poppense TaxID=170557 RepID=A0A7R9D880_TIMPO|nr:unnamed protein product [Timema poppensis]